MPIHKDLSSNSKFSSMQYYNLAFEGGEAETYVYDSPLFKKEIKLK